MARSGACSVIAAAALLVSSGALAAPSSTTLRSVTAKAASSAHTVQGSARRPSQALQDPTPAALAAERQALMAEIRGAPPDPNAAPPIPGGAPVGRSLAGASTQIAGSAVGPRGTQRIGSQTTLAGQDRKPCSQTSPFINVVKGSLTPGGQLAVEGLCMGSGGQLQIFGTFPGGAISLPVLVWSESGVAAAVPSDISGVTDQSVKVQLTRSDGRQSNERSALFRAKHQEIIVPATLIIPQACAVGPTGAPNAASDTARPRPRRWRSMSTSAIRQKASTPAVSAPLTTQTHGT